MKATPVVGTLLPQGAAWTPVSIPDTPNLRTGQTWTLADHVHKRSQGTFDGSLVSQVQK
jgi:hypothetical protein